MGDEYSFLQEKIKDEAGSVKSLRKKILRAILCGLIFGITACFAFFALKPWVEGIYGQDKVEVTIPEDEEVAENQEKEKEQKDKEVERQQMKLLENLQSTAKISKRAVVTVVGQNTIGEQIGQVSGVIIVDDGEEMLILSPNLSRKKQNRVKVRFADGNEYSAKLRKQDNNLGLGIYAVSSEELKKETKSQINIIELGNSRLVNIGDPAILLSNSMEQGMKISYGILSDNKAEKEISDGFTGVLLIDAAGAQYQDGVVLNQDGKVIGFIHESLQDNQMRVTAYSISDIKTEIERMSNGGGVPYCGIKGTVLPDKLKEAGVASGIYVEDIDVDSPAMEAGIQCGDVITHIEETEVSDMEQYRRQLLTKKVEEEIVLKGLRKGADSEYVEVEFHVVVGTK